MNTRNDPLFSRIESYAQRRAKDNTKSFIHWLHGANNQDDFCNECVFAMPALPGLIICHLLSLLGINIATARPHDLDEHKWCKRCENYSPRKKCLSIPEQINNEVNEQLDGGWRIEVDGLRVCENCGEHLNACLTGYGAEEELSHWEEYGPPSESGEWFMFTEMLNSIEDKHLVRLSNVWRKWNLTARKKKAA